jgi:hypothetical protein
VSSDASIFAKASRACYAVVLFATIVVGWLVVNNALGLQVIPLSLLPAFSLLSCILLLSIAIFGFYVRKIGRAYALRFLSIPSILIVVASLIFIVIFSPALIGISLSFYATLPPMLENLVALTILSVIGIFVLSLFLFFKGVRDLKTKLYLRGLKAFRRAEAVFWFLMVPYVALAIVLAPMVFSSSPAAADLGTRLWRTSIGAIIGVGDAVLLVLLASTLGKLGDPDILARAVDAAARAPPEPRLFGLPAKPGELYVTPKSVLESFQQVEADNKFDFSIFRERYLVLRRGSIFMLVPEGVGGAYIAYFIKLFDQTPTASKRFKAPIAFPRKKQFSCRIAGYPVAKFRGKFTLPAEVIRKTEGNELKYVRGSGIMYLVPRRDPSSGMYSPRVIFSREDLSEKFDKTVILKMIEAVSSESAK